MLQVKSHNSKKNHTTAAVERTLISRRIAAQLSAKAEVNPALHCHHLPPAFVVGDGLALLPDGAVAPLSALLWSPKRTRNLMPGGQDRREVELRLISELAEPVRVAS